MVLIDEDDVLAKSVASILVFCEFGIPLRHGTQQSLFIYERQEGDTLPQHLLSIHVYVELFWVEVDDLGIFLSHQLLERRRQMRTSKSGFYISECCGV